MHILYSLFSISLFLYFFHCACLEFQNQPSPLLPFPHPPPFFPPPFPTSLTTALHTGPMHPSLVLKGSTQTPPAVWFDFVLFVLFVLLFSAFKFVFLFVFVFFLLGSFVLNSFSLPSFPPFFQLILSLICLVSLSSAFLPAPSPPQHFLPTLPVTGDQEVPPMAIKGNTEGRVG